MKRWLEIQSSDTFKNLSNEDKVLARQQYDYEIDYIEKLESMINKKSLSEKVLNWEFDIIRNKEGFIEKIKAQAK